MVVDAADRTTGSNPQTMVGVHPLGVSGTAIGASCTSYRLYAAPGF
jgi:hypothetical protein